MSLRRLAVFAAASLAVALPYVSHADQQVTGAKQVVIAGHPEAAKLGMAVLNAGGDAADALVTTSLALGLTEPGNSGPGGKLVMLYYDAKSKTIQSVVAMDAAPSNVDIPAIKADQNRKRGTISVCVPGNVAALDLAHRKWGSKPWKQLVLPVAKLADEGWVLTDKAASLMAEFPGDVDPEAARLFNPGGKAPRGGDRFKNPDYAKTMRTLANEGASSFYEGTIAKQIAKAFEGKQGPSLADLKAYKPRLIEPLHAKVGGREVFTAPPPLIGGAIVLGTLAGLDGTDWSSMKPRDAEYIDTVARMLQQVYPEANIAADTPDSRAKVEAMLSPDSIAALRSRAAKGAMEPTGPRKKVAMTETDGTLDDGLTASTTHLLIIDAKGNIACVTQSLGNHFGAAVVPPGTGFLMNNCINNFAFTEGNPNYIAPGKWPRSTMAPTIVTGENGKPLLAIGSPAGQRIPSTIVQVTLDALEFQRPLLEAVQAPRFHLRRPASKKDPASQIDLEEGTAKAIEGDLAGRGWQAKMFVDNEFYFGSVNAAFVRENGRIDGVADDRRTGDASGGE
jgi:gamma-glutamyltranspeptidase / glutathione hydrolase